MEHLVLKVGGMTCTGCVASVTRVLQSIEGVSRVEVSLAEGQATVEYDRAKASAERLRTAVEEAGFDATV